MKRSGVREFLRLVGVREIAIRLGVSRQRIQQLADRDDFPEPFQQLTMGRVWWEHEIEDWIRGWHTGDPSCEPAGPGCDHDAVGHLAERVADHLAERGHAFIEGDVTEALADVLRLFLKTAGISLESRS
jgi:predicted DNA-binding transcriptional regulator AlpA